MGGQYLKNCLQTFLNRKKSNEEFIKNYYEDSDKEYILEVGLEYPQKLLNLQSDLTFLSERMKINKREKLV